MKDQVPHPYKTRGRSIVRICDLQRPSCTKTWN